MLTLDKAEIIEVLGDKFQGDTMSNLDSLLAGSWGAYFIGISQKMEGQYFVTVNDGFDAYFKDLAAVRRMLDMLHTEVRTWKLTHDSGEVREVQAVSPSKAWMTGFTSNPMGFWKVELA